MTAEERRGRGEPGSEPDGVRDEVEVIFNVQRTSTISSNITGFPTDRQRHKMNAESPVVPRISE